MHHRVRSLSQRHACLGAFGACGSRAAADLSSGVAPAGTAASASFKLAPRSTPSCIARVADSSNVPVAPHGPTFSQSRPPSSTRFKANAEKQGGIEGGKTGAGSVFQESGS
eukprot:219224-Rhodomonas_salina.3